jgi:hypothetical protein
MGSPERLEPEIARREVELFVVGGIVRDVHLPVDAGHGAVGLEDCDGVMIEPGRPALEQRRDDHDAELL